MRIPYGSFGPTSALIHDFTAKAEAGTTLADVLNPDYWSNVATRIGEHARIEVVSADGGLDVLLRVVSIKRTENENPAIIVKPLRIGYAEVPAAVETKKPRNATRVGPYEVEFAGAHKWRVRLGSQIIDKGIGTEELALAEANRLAALIGEPA